MRPCRAVYLSELVQKGSSSTLLAQNMTLMMLVCVQVPVLGRIKAMDLAGLQTMQEITYI